MLGADKEPWVWVMGEGPGDLPYEELVKKREQEHLKKLRHQEEEDRRKAEELALLESQGVCREGVCVCACVCTCVRAFVRTCSGIYLTMHVCVCMHACMQ